MTKVRGKAKNALHEGKVFLNTHRLPLAFVNHQIFVIR